MKPTPKAELVIEAWTKSLQIHTTSADADAWVQAEAPQYGQLVKLSTFYIFYCSPAYDIEQVAAHLNSYNQKG